MGLILITAPATEPVTLTEAKAHLRVTGADDDTYITALITMARQYAEVFTRRALITQTWDLYLDAFPDYDIALPMPDLQSVTSVTYVDTDGVSQVLSSALYQVDLASIRGRIAPAYNEEWPDTREETYGAVKVRFVCGYGAASAVPETIKGAMKLLIGHWFENRMEATAETIKQIPMGANNLMWMERVP